MENLVKKVLEKLQLDNKIDCNDYQGEDFDKLIEYIKSNIPYESIKYSDNDLNELIRSRSSRIKNFINEYKAEKDFDIDIAMKCINNLLFYGCSALELMKKNNKE